MVKDGEYVPVAQQGDSGNRAHITRRPYCKWRLANSHIVLLVVYL